MDKLHYLMNNFGNLPAQGSEKWLTARKKRFGGSELYQAIDRTPYQLAKLVKEKKEQNFKGNNACQWGTNFERVAKYKMKLDGFEIHELGAVVCPKIPLAYSPDGLFVKDGKLYLLEIKCPFARVIKAGQEIKPQYYRQVQVGCEVLPVDKVMFCRFVFRRCKRAFLPFKAVFNRPFHFNYKVKNLKEVLYTGLMWWDLPGKPTEGWVQKNHTDAWLSIDTDIQAKCDTLTNGTYMFFKCYFQEYKEFVTPQLSKGDIGKLWNAYHQLTK